MRIAAKPLLKLTSPSCRNRAFPGNYFDASRQPPPSGVSDKPVAVCSDSIALFPSPDISYRRPATATAVHLLRIHRCNKSHPDSRTNKQRSCARTHRLRIALATEGNQRRSPLPTKRSGRLRPKRGKMKLCVEPLLPLISFGRKVQKPRLF